MGAPLDGKAVEPMPFAMAGDEAELKRKFGLPVDTEHKSTVLRPWLFKGPHHVRAIRLVFGELLPGAPARSCAQTKLYLAVDCSRVPAPAHGGCTL